MGQFLKNDRDVYQAVSLLELPWLEHGFGTRNSEAWNQSIGMVNLAQIHSDILIRVPAGSAGRIGEGDGLFTDEPGLRIGVRTADCVPVLLVDSRRRVVAAVHAGWRGSARSITMKAVRAMGDNFGSAPADIVAAIGPSIGACCYQVGPEVATQFQEWFPERDNLGRRTWLDLPKANLRQLRSAGLAEENISVLGLCTCCSEGQFYSRRREGAHPGRMVSSICIF